MDKKSTIASSIGAIGGLLLGIMITNDYQEYQDKKEAEIIMEQYNQQRKIEAEKAEEKFKKDIKELEELLDKLEKTFEEEERKKAIGEITL